MRDRLATGDERHLRVAIEQADFAFGEMIRLVLINWIPFSGGYAGIASIPKVSFFGLSMRDQPGVPPGPPAPATASAAKPAAPPP